MERFDVEYIAVASTSPTKGSARRSFGKVAEEREKEEEPVAIASKRRLE